MQERQITIGRETYTLNPPFVVLATQNPIEMEGTHPQPEAQLDRFLFCIRVVYPIRRLGESISGRAADSVARPGADLAVSSEITAGVSAEEMPGLPVTARSEKSEMILLRPAWDRPVYWAILVALFAARPEMCGYHLLF